jgi:Mg2+-importing ATPase
VPFVESRAAWPLILATLLIMAAGVAMPFSPLASAVRMQPLPGTYFAYLGATLLAYAFFTQQVKAWFFRRYGWK